MNKRFLHFAMAVGTAGLLAACGGSDGDGPVGQVASPTPATATPGTVSTSGVPTSAQQSVVGLVAFLNELLGQTSETSEPIALGDAVLPTSETAEPSALN